MNKLCFCHCFAKTFEEMKDDLRKPKDFVKEKLTLTKKPLESFWRMYRGQIVKPYKRLCRRYKKYPHFHFLDNVTADEYRSVILSGEYEIVILFSHCKDGGMEEEMIEFYDCMVSSRNLAKWIPANSSIYLDFSVCKPTTLRKVLEVIPKRQFVIVNWEWEINLKDSMEVYELILEEILSHPGQGYARSVINTLKQFFKN